MVQLLRLLCGALIGLLRSAVRREAEILVIRHQVNVLRRKSPSRPALSNVDRLLFVLLLPAVPKPAMTLATSEISLWPNKIVGGPKGRDRGSGTRRFDEIKHARFATDAAF